MLFSIRVRETLGTEFQIEAENKDHALALVMEKYYACEILLGREYFTGVTFNITEKNYDYRKDHHQV